MKFGLIAVLFVSFLNLVLFTANADSCGSVATTSIGSGEAYAKEKSDAYDYAFGRSMTNASHACPTILGAMCNAQSHGGGCELKEISVKFDYVSHDVHCVFSKSNQAWKCVSNARGSCSGECVPVIDE